MNYIVVDFEMNPVASEHIEEKQISRFEIIEIGAVIMDEQFLMLGEFKTLVKPQFMSIPASVSHLSGHRKPLFRF